VDRSAINVAVFPREKLLAIVLVRRPFEQAIARIDSALSHPICCDLLFGIALGPHCANGFRYSFQFFLADLLAGADSGVHVGRISN
jgi:hypothetical protein